MSVSYVDRSLSTQDNNTIRERLKACIEKCLIDVGIEINKGALSYLTLEAELTTESLLEPSRQVVLVTLQMKFTEPFVRPNTGDTTHAITWSKQSSWVTENRDDELTDLLTSVVEEDLTRVFAVDVKCASGRNRADPDEVLDDRIKHALRPVAQTERRTGVKDPGS